MLSQTSLLTMNNHQWFQSILAPARKLDDGKIIKSIGSPFLQCWICKIQIHMVGYGKNGRLIYRKTSSHEWQFQELPCQNLIMVSDWNYLVELRKYWIRTGHQNIPHPEDRNGFLG